MVVCVLRDQGVRGLQGDSSLIESVSPEVDDQISPFDSIQGQGLF
jgi:hypothetical protein